jgi:copper chaperone
MRSRATVSNQYLQKKQKNKNMETVKFKTNIKCSGCVAGVTPALNEVAGEHNWEVNLQTTDRILTVTTDKANQQQIKEAVERAGYRAEVI